MKPILTVDANVITRLFLNDHPELSLKARKIFDSASNGKIQIYIDEVIIAEISWVLRSVYKYDKITITTLLEKLMSPQWIINPRKKLILKTLSRYKKYKLSYIDSWIWTISENARLSFVTFDKTLNKLSKST